MFENKPIFFLKDKVLDRKLRTAFIKKRRMTESREVVELTLSYSSVDSCVLIIMSLYYLQILTGVSEVSISLRFFFTCLLSSPLALTS